MDGTHCFSMSMRSGAWGPVGIGFERFDCVERLSEVGNLLFGIALWNSRFEVRMLDFGRWVVSF